MYGDRCIGELLDYFKMLAARLAQIFVERHDCSLERLVFRLMRALFNNRMLAVDHRSAGFARQLRNVCFPGD